MMNKLIQNLLSKIGYALGLGLARNTPTLRQEIEHRAVQSTADYVSTNMSDAIMFMSHRELLDFTVARSSKAGAVMEFGVYKANTLNYLAKLIEKRSPKEFLWGFDSFEGLPNDWAGYIITKETFDVQGQLPKVRRNVRLVKGFFDKSIGPWLSTHGSDIESISILHIDSDLYESCKVILDMLERFIKPKTFILFDEYFNYPNWQNHEFLAFKEFCQKGNINYRYRGFYEQKVLVEII